MQRFLIGALFVGLLTLASTSARVRAADDRVVAGGDAAELKSLQKERVSTLARLVDVLTAQYRVGAVDFGDLHQARHELLDAKLELAATSAERITILEQQVKAAKESLGVAQRKFDAGRVSEAEVLRTRASYLEIRIKLARERDNSASSTR